MTPISVAPGSLLSIGSLTSNVEESTNGALRVTWYHKADVTGDGDAFTIKWKSSGKTGDFPISLNYNAEDICDSAKAEVRVSPGDGNVRILDRPVGDIYSDRLVNMKDITYFARWFNKQETLDNAQTLAADVYYDDTLDVKDLTELAQILGKSIPANGGENAALMGADSAPFRVTVSNAVQEEGQNVALTVSGSDCAGIAAFRFRVEVPDGYAIRTVTPSDLLNDGTFAYNSESGVIFWYSDKDCALNGTLFTLNLEKTGIPSLPAKVTLEYAGEDFFTVQDYAEVPVTLSGGIVRDADEFDSEIEEISVSGSLLNISIHTERDSAVLYVMYYRDNQMVGMDAESVSRTKNACQMEIPSNANSCKAILLEANGYQPIATAKEFAI